MCAVAHARLPILVLGALSAVGSAAFPSQESRSFNAIATFADTPGTKKWSSAIGAPQGYADYPKYALSADNSLLYAAVNNPPTGSGCALYAVNVADGTKKWTHVIANESDYESQVSRSA